MAHIKKHLVVYKRPGDVVKKHNEFQQYLKDLVKRTSVELIAVGDFNLGQIKWDPSGGVNHYGRTRRMGGFAETCEK